MSVEERLSPEQERRAWRLLQLLDAGYPLDGAQRLAALDVGPDKVDLHEACDLVRNGCSPALALEILL